MNWLQRLLGRPPDLDSGQAAALAAYQALPAVDGASPLVSLRFVVADVETTGLNPITDKLISIGAVSVEQRAVRLSSGFQVVLRQPKASASANILIHGIDGTTQLQGADPATALIEFLQYADNAPIVGFHAGFDRTMIERATRSVLGCKPANPWLDLDYLAPALLGAPKNALPQSLDEWLQQFHIDNHARHNALADALATAQLLQVVLAAAIAGGATTLDDLAALEQDQRWLRRVN